MKKQHTFAFYRLSTGLITKLNMSVIFHSDLFDVFMYNETF